jgi:hypothetical protein
MTCCIHKLLHARTRRHTTNPTQQSSDNIHHKSNRQQCGSMPIVHNTFLHAAHKHISCCCTTAVECWLLPVQTHIPAAAATSRFWQHCCCHVLLLLARMTSSNCCSACYLRQVDCLPLPRHRRLPPPLACQTAQPSAADASCLWVAQAVCGSHIPITIRNPQSPAGGLAVLLEGQELCCCCCLLKGQ